MPNIVIEPYEKLTAFLVSIVARAEWVGKLPGGHGRDKDGTAAAAWPCLSWRSITFGSGGPDVESFDLHRDRIEFNFWGPGDDALRELGFLLDDAFKPIDEAVAPLLSPRRNIDSTHYRCLSFRSVSGRWNIVDWTDIKTLDNRFLKQYTKDYELRYARRQNVS